MNNRKKGAVELSINTIVIVVIGITLLTLGLKWITGMMGKITTQTEGLTDASDRMIMDIFEDTEKSISTAANVYTVKSGRTLKDIRVILRNNAPAQYPLSYTLEPTIMPIGLTATDIVGNPPGTGAMKWDTSSILVNSGKGLSDIILFDTSGLLLGDYKFNALIQCGECPIEGDRHQFIVTII